MNPNPNPVSATSPDGWTAESFSANPPSAADLHAALTNGDPAAPPAAPATPPAAPVEPPAAPVVPITEPPVAAAPTVPGAEPVKPKVRPAQERIDQAVARQRQAEDLALQERTRREDLERRLDAATRAPSAPVAPAVPAAPAAPVAEPAPPEPLWAGLNGYEAQGKTWEDWQRDHTKWQTAEILKAATAAASDAADKKYADARAKETADQAAAEDLKRKRDHDLKMTQKLDAVRAKRPDFDTIVTANLGDIQSAFINYLVEQTDAGGEILLYLAENRTAALSLSAIAASPNLKHGHVEAISSSPIPLKLLSHFAAHPDEFQTLITQSPILAARAIAQLETRLGVVPPASTPVVPSTTHARPPLRAVVGGAPNAGPDPNVAEVPFGPEYVNAENRREREAKRFRAG